MNSRDEVGTNIREVRRSSRKLSRISTHLSCVGDQTRNEAEVYVKNANNNDSIVDNHVKNKKCNDERYYNALPNNTSPNFLEKSCVRSKALLSQILASPFVDTFAPTHQLGPDVVIPAEKLWTAAKDGAVKQTTLTKEVPECVPALSVVTVFYERATREPERICLSVNRNHKWIHWTWKEYQEQVELVARSFIKLGLERFHSVAILGFNAPEWFIANFAAIFAGGVSLGIYLTSSPAACELLLKNSEADIVVVENEIQLQKILEIRDRLPQLKAIIQYLGEPTHPDVLSWNEVIEIGRMVPEESLQKRIKNLAINQCCTLIYTSGTTGEPKGVMLSHDNLYYTSVYTAKVWDVEHGHKYVSFLPLSHIAAQIADIYTTAQLELHVHFAQPNALKGGLVDTLTDVRPGAFFAVPRVYEKISEKILESVGQMSFVKKNFILWALRNVQQYTKSCLDGHPVTPYGHTIADLLVQKIRQAVGLNCALFLYSGGAQLSPNLQQFFLSLNMVVLECLGMSECSGPHMMNTMQNYCLGSVGRDNPYTETRLHHCDFQGHGEICFRGRNVFMGYLNDEIKTMEAFDAEGWFHSGDIGCYNSDHFLFITGRIKELLITAGGENIAQLPIEDKVKTELPLISHAVLIGDKKKFLSMLLTLKCEIDMETLVPTSKLTPGSISWCSGIGSNAKTVEDIINKNDCKVMGAIQKGIDSVNRTAISNAQRIQKWTILPVDFSIPGGELGPTLKMKRSVIVRKYENVIDNFYKV